MDWDSEARKTYACMVGWAGTAVLSFYLYCCTFPIFSFTFTFLPIPLSLVAVHPPRLYKFGFTPFPSLLFLRLHSSWLPQLRFLPRLASDNPPTSLIPFRSSAIHCFLLSSSLNATSLRFPALSSFALSSSHIQYVLCRHLLTTEHQ